MIGSSINTILEPLAIANNVAQAGNCRLDHITLTLSNLYRIYSRPILDDAIRTKLLHSLEKRWAAADQDVFILAVFLNPYIRALPFSTSILPQSELYDMAERVYKCFYNAEPNFEFLRASTDYYNGIQEFSSEKMKLDTIRRMFDNEVSLSLVCFVCNLPYCCFLESIDRYMLHLEAPRIDPIHSIRGTNPFNYCKHCRYRAQF